MTSAFATPSDTIMPHRIAPLVQHAAGYFAGTGVTLTAAWAFIANASHDPFSVVVALGTMAGSLAMGYAAAIKSYMAFVDWRENRIYRRERAKLKHPPRS